MIFLFLFGPNLPELDLIYSIRGLGKDIYRGGRRIRGTGREAGAGGGTMTRGASADGRLDPVYTGVNGPRAPPLHWPSESMSSSLRSL